MRTLLKQMRADLHLLEQKADKDFERTRFTSLGITALQEAAMFCGNTLKELNMGETPYVNSSDSSNNKIDAYHVDQEIQPIELPVDFDSYTYIQKVKYFRMIIENQSQVIANHYYTYDLQIRLARVTYNQIYIALVRAKNWFGMELGRIRDNESGK